MNNKKIFEGEEWRGLVSWKREQGENSGLRIYSIYTYIIFAMNICLSGLKSCALKY